MTHHVRERVKLFGAAQKRLIEPPDLLEIQKDSFKLFLAEGLKEALLSFSPIKGMKAGMSLSLPEISRSGRQNILYGSAL